MKSLICLCPFVQMSKFSKVNENIWQLWDFLSLFLLSMIQLRPRFCPVLRYHLSRILRTEVSSSSVSSPTLVSAQTSSVLVGQTIESKRQRNRNSGLGGNTKGPSFGGVVCYYCHKFGHVIRDCKKRQTRNQKFQSARIASTTEASDRSVQFLAAELSRFQLYQDSLRSPSTPITAIAESGNPNKCLVSSSSSEWVIGSGATDHMTSNSSLVSTF